MKYFFSAKFLSIGTILLLFPLTVFSAEQTICTGTANEIQKLITAPGFDINKLVNRHDTPLTKAIECNRDLDIFKLLVQYGANVNKHRRSGISPISDTVERRDNVPVFKFLIENGADKNNALFDVYRSADDENFEMLIDYLLEKGADINARYKTQMVGNSTSGPHGKKLLTVSVENKDKVDYLLQKGYDINALDGTEPLPVENDTNGHMGEFIFSRGGVTPLIAAVQNGNAEGYLYLLEKGADKNIKDTQEKTAADYIEKNTRFKEKFDKALAQKKEKEDKLEALRKTDKLAKDEKGYTPFENALMQHSVTADELEALYDERIQIDPDIMPHQSDIVSKDSALAFFMKKGILPLSQKNKDKMICEIMHDLSSSMRPPSFKKAMEMVQFLIQRGANGTSALSCGYLDYETVNNVRKYLIENGAQLDSKNFSLLLEYVSYCTEVRCVPAKPDFVKYLLEKGADINHQVQSHRKLVTPLTGALLTKQPKEIIEILVNAGADVNVKDKEKLTPLMIAAQRSDMVSIEILLKANADVNALDFQQKNALYYLDLNKMLVGTDVYNQIKEKTNQVLPVIPISAEEVEAKLEKELKVFERYEKPRTNEQKDLIRYRYYLQGHHYTKAMELFSKPYVKEQYKRDMGEYYYTMAYLSFILEDYPTMVKNYKTAIDNVPNSLKRTLKKEWLIRKQPDFLHFYQKILSKNPELKDDLIQLLLSRKAKIGTLDVTDENDIIEAIKQLKIPSISTFAQNETVKREYFDNGLLKSETPMKNGQKHGTEKLYNSQAYVIAEIPYENGKKNGVELRYKYASIVNSMVVSAGIIYKDNVGVRYDRNKVEIAKHVHQEDDITLIYDVDDNLIGKHDKYGHFTNLTKEPQCCDFNEEKF